MQASHIEQGLSKYRIIVPLVCALLMTNAYAGPLTELRVIGDSAL